MNAIPKIPKGSMLGEIYGPAMKVTTEAEAEAYLRAIVDRLERDGSPLTRGELFHLARENAAYWAGYYDHETRARVEKLFRCEHPMFGAAEKGAPPPDVLLAIGEAFGKGFIRLSTRKLQQDALLEIELLTTELLVQVAPSGRLTSKAREQLVAIAELAKLASDGEHP